VSSRMTVTLVPREFLRLPDIISSLSSGKMHPERDCLTRQISKMLIRYWP
jgi:hypothetical protein